MTTGLPKSTRSPVVKELELSDTIHWNRNSLKEILQRFGVPHPNDAEFDGLMSIIDSGHSMEVKQKNRRWSEVLSRSLIEKFILLSTKFEVFWDCEMYEKSDTFNFKSAISEI